MKLHIILQGKCRNKAVLSLVREYEKRLSATYPLDFAELGERGVSEFLKHAPYGFYARLDDKGREFTSVELAHELARLKEKYRDLYFFVGGAEGHTETVLKQVGESWSLSKLTMPFELSFAVLSEQLYRAASILSGHPYHKE